MLILKELHDKLDAAVAEAYGWPADLSDNDILVRLVALNQQRAREEANGTVRWLRPDYQIPRFGSPKQKAELDLVGGETGGVQPAPTAGPKPNFPADEVAQTAAVMAALAAEVAPLGADSACRTVPPGASRRREDWFRAWRVAANGLRRYG